MPPASRRDPAGELDHLEPARDLAHRVGEHLAVLGGEDPRRFLAALVHGSRIRKSSSARFASDVARQAGKAAFAAACRGGDLLDRRQIDLAGLLPERRVEHRAGAAGCPVGSPPIQWWMRVNFCCCSVGGVASSVISASSGDHESLAR